MPKYSIDFSATQLLQGLSKCFSLVQGNSTFVDSLLTWWDSKHKNTIYIQYIDDILIEMDTEDAEKWEEDWKITLSSTLISCIVQENV